MLTLINPGRVLDGIGVVPPRARMNRTPSDPHGMQRRGVLFVLSSPSGAGKSTIARKLLAVEPELEMSVSATTRAMRPGVPTTICAPWFSERRSLDASMPPTQVTTRPRAPS